MEQEIFRSDTNSLQWPFPVDPADWASVLGGSSFPAALWSGSEMRFRWANEPFLDLLGPSPKFDALGMPVRGFLGDSESAVRFQDVAYTGLAVADPLYEHRDLDTGLREFWQLTMVPVPSRFAQPYDVLMVAVNVTAQVLEEREEAALREDLRGAVDLIDTTILSTLDADEILQRVVVEATEAFGADWGWVALRKPGLWTINNVHGWPEEMVGKSFSEDRLSLPRLCAQERAVVVADDFYNGPSEHRRLMEEHDIAAFILIPVLLQGDVSAVVGFSWNCETQLTGNQREMAEKLAVSLSLAVRNARTYQTEHELSRKLQSAFFTVPEALEGVEIGHLYHSASSALGARVGGDFYDLVRGADSRIGILIGDVSGHGIDSTALTTLVKSAMRVQALDGVAPKRALESANSLVLRDAPADVIVSAFFGSLDVSSGRLSYCSAGHPPGVICRQNEDPVPLPRRQMVMGVDGEAEYDNSEAWMGGGDLLVLYTDGLLEARDRDGRAYGQRRLLTTLREIAGEETSAIPEHLFMDAFSHADGRIIDDVAILAVRRTGGDAAGDQPRLALEAV